MIISPVSLACHPLKISIEKGSDDLAYSELFTWSAISAQKSYVMDTCKIAWPVICLHCK